MIIYIVILSQWWWEQLKAANYELIQILKHYEYKKTA